MKNPNEILPQCKKCTHLSKMYYFHCSSLRDINYICGMRYSFVSDCEFWELDENAGQSSQGIKEILLDMKEKLSNIESILLAEENAPK
ncbi:MAG: hypothetical protein K2J16_05125 [Clostridia bacterium]|nr:hypothetical protein [Clostridia bacterium]